MATVANQGAAPPLLGHLWKQKPSWPWRLQWRYARLEGGILYWFKNAELARGGIENCAGCVDLAFNQCSIREEAAAGDRFQILPGAQGWTQGNFTGVEDRRTFVFDCKGCEHGREVWIAALRQHCEDRRAAASFYRSPPRREQDEALDAETFIGESSPASESADSPPGVARKKSSLSNSDDEDTPDSFQGAQVFRVQSEFPDRSQAGRSSIADRYDFDILNQLALARGETSEVPLGVSPLDQVPEQYALDGGDEDSDDGQGLPVNPDSRRSSVVGESLTLAFEGLEEARFRQIQRSENS